MDGPAAVLFQHEAGQIVERTNAFLGYAAVGQIRIVQGPVGAPGGEEPEPTLPISAEDETRLALAFEYYRTLGCLIVIDDFGAGYSNFDRIWRLKPDIVKIDREMTRRATVEPLARRMFAGIVSVLHEAGALVCVEGIETEAEALCATDADADLVQGHYFAPPGAELLPENARRDVFERLITSQIGRAHV